MILLRVLFEVPRDDGHMPGMESGLSRPAPPRDPDLVPRFPIQIVDDIPLLLIAGYTLEGRPPSVQPHLRYFRAKGVMRAAKLVPNDRPLRVLEKLKQLPAWKYTTRTNRDGAMIIGQLLTLIEDVRPFADESSKWKFAFKVAPPDQWSGFVAEFERTPIHWDPQSQQYRITGPSSQN
jgi:hypothetical protein